MLFRRTKVVLPPATFSRDPMQPRGSDLLTLPRALGASAPSKKAHRVQQSVPRSGRSTAFVPILRQIPPTSIDYTGAFCADRAAPEQRRQATARADAVLRAPRNAARERRRLPSRPDRLTVD